MGLSKGEQWVQIEPRHDGARFHRNERIVGLRLPFLSGIESDTHAAYRWRGLNRWFSQRRQKQIQWT